MSRRRVKVYFDGKAWRFKLDGAKPSPPFPAKWIAVERARLDHPDADLVAEVAVFPPV